MIKSQAQQNERRLGMDFTTKKLLHGGDYNPEQWLDHPEILKKDIEMLKEAGCNVVSLGIFSWSTLEPREGEFHYIST